jgi:hypothetical protein
MEETDYIIGVIFWDVLPKTNVIEVKLWGLSVWGCQWLALVLKLEGLLQRIGVL